MTENSRVCFLENSLEINLNALLQEPANSDLVKTKTVDFGTQGNDKKRTKRFNGQELQTCLKAVINLLKDCGSRKGSILEEKDYRKSH